MIACIVMRRVKFDDAMENYQIYGTASFTAMLASVFFLPEEGILWGSMSSGSILGIQLLGWASVSVWTTVITWIYFFSLKRCKLLKVKKAKEILGLDSVSQATSKRIDLKALKAQISLVYPDHLKKGCWLFKDVNINIKLISFQSHRLLLKILFFLPGEPV